MRHLLIALCLALVAPFAAAQQGPLRIEITEGVVEPLTFAIPALEAEGAAAAEWTDRIKGVIAADLAGTGLFREIPSSSFIANRTTFAEPVRYPDWRAINAQAMITGAVAVSGGQVTVKFRIYDVFSGAELGQGQQLVGTEAGWR
ncbi:MAG: Tol-Pal system protein TolB, partial [Pseudomonadota bacterium]